MIEEAQRFAEEDRRKKAEVETRNQADQLAYTTEKLLRENADRIPANLQEEIKAKLEALRNAINSGDIASIQTAMNDLNQSLTKVGQAVYSQAGGAQPGGGQTPGTGGQGNEPPGTVEGEFREE